MGDHLRLWAGLLALGCGESTTPLFRELDASVPPPSAALDATPSAPQEADTGPEDLDAQILAMCSVAEPCGESFAQLVENSTHNIAGASACLLRALAARAPG